MAYYWLINMAGCGMKCLSCNKIKHQTCLRVFYDHGPQGCSVITNNVTLITNENSCLNIPLTVEDRLTVGNIGQLAQDRVPPY